MQNKKLHAPKWVRYPSRLVSLTLLCVWLLAGCTVPYIPVPARLLLSPRAAMDPLAAVEGYLQRYQPGPLPRVFQTTRIYDRHGALLAELFDEGRRTWAGLERISPHLIRATVSTEDDSFFQNIGVDPLRVAAAALRNLRAGAITSGASTITMQLARNLFFQPEQRYDPALDRKLLEAKLAQELTSLYGKNELLEMYFNLLNYGNLAYGPEAAAQLYFGKPAADLTLAEATLLAGIPQAPALLDPYRDFAAVKQRQRIVLDLMVRHGNLSLAEADQVFDQLLTLKDRPKPTPNLAPHFVQYLAATLDRQFGAGYTRRAGFTIVSTLDLPMQNLAQGLVAQKVAELKSGYDLNNGALVAMKPNSGEVLVMVGSADFADPAIDGQVNVAVSLRQPGSAIKPILYATALDENLVSPATVLWDVPVTYTVGAGQIYRPRNYDDKFHGPVTVRSALANSYNVASVKLLDALGVERMLQSAQALGVRSLNRPVDWYGLSLTLGGGEVTLLDLTTAFHTLASGGNYWPSRPILSITDSLGNTSNLAQATESTQVVSPEAAFLVTDILSDNEARTPMFGANSLLRLSRPAAAKTGTTTDFRDNWTLGYTRYLVAGAWAGNSDGRPMRNISGVTGAGPIWHEFMEAVLNDPALLATIEAPEDAAAWTFTPPPGVRQRPDCPPGLTCRRDGEFFTDAWLAATGDQGPLADSVEQAATAPVYAQGADASRRIGFCTAPDAAVRTVLKASADLGRFTARAESKEGGIAEHGENSADLFADEAEVEPIGQINQERLHVLAWSFRYPLAVNFGPCEQLKELAPRALALDPQVGAGLRLVVDLAAAHNPDLSDVAGGDAVELAALGPSSALVPSVAEGRYTLAQPIQHDLNCPGQYVMGMVVNWAGAPVAGVTVQLSDEWGNQASAVSKSGASDFGRFDFPIPASSPHDLYLWVVDDTGNQISPTITVPHRQGDAPDVPCHHVVIQGG